jgi:aspartate carbamoyltransferase catalytic subunit
MFTIRQEKGGCDGLSIGMCGDLLNGRTVHSLSKALSPHSGNTYYLISTEKLKMPGYAVDMLSANGGRVIECRSLDECIDLLDVLYMTRIQRERFSSESEYRSQAGIYILDCKKLENAKKELVILHPLPKVDEISYEVDDDPRAKYFEQAENALYLRMALILTMTENYPSRLPIKGEKYEFTGERYCKNPVCVSNHEKYLPKIVKQNDERKYCGYCERDI